jgi:hypothetical protein
MSAIIFAIGFFCWFYHGLLYGIENLKVAVFFSGRVQGYEDSYKFLKNFIDKYNMDVFCSINSEFDQYHQDFVKNFKCKKYNFELFKQGNFMLKPLIREFNNTNNGLSMFYNHRKCMDMILKYQLESNLRYDVVVYMRADILPTTRNGFSLVLDDYLHVPAGADWDGLNDQIAYGSVEIMNRYCDLFYYVETYCNQLGCPPYPERLLKFHVNYLHIPVKRFQFSYTLNPKRHS